jgi:hypothetical protein
MTIELQAEYDWSPVMTESGKEFVYPTSLGNRVRGEYNRPAIYRWRIEDGGKISAAAIAECENLARTVALFNEPTAPQAINKLKSVLSEHVFRGSDIGLDVLNLSAFEFGGKDKGADALKESDLRKLLETLLIHDARLSGIRLLSTAQEKPTLPF